MIRWPNALLLALSFSLTAPLNAQGTRVEYERANQLRERVRGNVFKASVEPHWFAGNERFWYRNDLPGDAREFIVVDAVNRTRQPAFDRGLRTIAAVMRLSEPRTDPTGRGIGDRRGQRWGLRG